MMQMEPTTEAQYRWGSLLTVRSSITTGCIPDIPGTTWWTAATAMAGSISLTVAAICGLVWYVMKTEANKASVGSVSAPPVEEGLQQPAATEQQPLLKKKRVHIPVLDGMRTMLAIVIVFAHHPLGLGVPDKFKFFLNPGWSMQFFMVLSGFVAQYTAGSREFDWHASVKYITRRMIRLIPLYQMALVLQFAVVIFIYGQAGRPYAAWSMNAFFLQTLLPVKVCGQPDEGWTFGYTHFNANGVGWFVACLLWCSFVFPFLFNNRPRGLAACAMTLAAVVACRSIPDVMNPEWGNYTPGVLHLYAFMPCRLLEYVAGMLSAQIAMDANSEAWGISSWCWVFDVVLCSLLAAVWVSIDIVGLSWQCSGDYCLTALCCVVCICARFAAEVEAQDGPKGGLLHRFLASWPISYAGRYSFAMYIFQVSLMGNTQDFYIHRFLALCLVAVVAHTCLEEPIRVMAESRLNQPAAVKSVK